MWSGFGWLSPVMRALQGLICSRESLITPGTVRHKLMRRESNRRLAAAETLSNAAGESDETYLLRLLGFELLLKLAVELKTGRSAPKHHQFHKIFRLLPRTVQKDILRLAGERIGPSALGTNRNSVLKDLGRNFVNLRYPFERYSHMTETEYLDVGAKWLASGAQDSQAHFRFHPEELRGLTAALQQLTNGC